METHGIGDFREIHSDDERPVPVDDDAELELPPPTIDPFERVEDDTDDLVAEERDAAIESGHLEP
ncbi:hypothetical protein HDC37_001261 [Microbacterium sp. AK009]|uniref:hypothetical protein n=1 Tax=Microbacterium sp. AK009 TaxID=2723068 RepID=UPI00179B21F3|nr:hypothetical protein [Microbacterium sp. AK009]NYF16447.1 hypothetical protein [Microbacterium sp. AK009]